MPLCMVQINKPKWDAWKMLPEAVRSGAVPFALAHGGLDMHQVRSTLPGPAACTQSHAHIMTAHHSDRQP